MCSGVLQSGGGGEYSGFTEIKTVKLWIILGVQEILPSILIINLQQSTITHPFTF